MSIFDIITLFGGLAMFLYGMRLMGDGLKEGSSGTLKRAMENVTNNPVKAFFLGLAVTAIIQSSTATIVITSGLVGAGIISLPQSIGIIVGANVGTTVTGQIIRLLDLDASSVSWLQIFKPSTLAPVALIIGIIILMGFKGKKTTTAGSIAIGFGILFNGLLNMTSAVDALGSTGIFENLFSRLGQSPVIGYLTGAGVAFVLQSSSATIGILQAFSSAGGLTWKAIYAVIVGIYLGDCVTTAIVCSIGAKAEAKRVGVVNILFNLSETLLVLAAVTVVHKMGLIDGLWETTVDSGIIANTNSIFNLGCAVLLLPIVKVYEKLSRRIVKDDPVEVSEYQDKLDALSSVFFNTPALALRSCYDILMAMVTAGKENLNRAYTMLINGYNEKSAELLVKKENDIDLMSDRLSAYLAELSPHINLDYQVAILNQYYRLVTEFEHLGDRAEDVMYEAKMMHEKKITFSPQAVGELTVLKELVDRLLIYTIRAFEKRSVEDAIHIEPLEGVCDDIINFLKNSHLERLRDGKCNVVAGTLFLNLLTEIEQVSDICSNVGISVITRVNPELSNLAHEYVSALHEGSNDNFNAEYEAVHEEFFAKL